MVEQANGFPARQSQNLHSQGSEFMNRNALWLFRFQVGRLWHRALSRRSQNGRVLRERMRRLINRRLPLPTVCHPYPLRRMGVITQGKSRMRETRSSASVEGLCQERARLSAMLCWR